MKIRPLIFLGALSTVRALATEPAPPAVEHPARWSDLFRTSAFTITSENDKYFAGTDRHYTNGLRLSFLGDTRVDESPFLVQKIAEYVPTLNNETARLQIYKVGLSLGQNIYTPADTDATTPSPADRPYAGWLYGALTFQAQSLDSRLLRVVEIAVGLVGPSALGRQAQNGFHDIIGAAHANGWAHQLHDEPGFILSWERRYRVGKIPLGVAGLQSDLIRPAAGSLASAHRYSAYFFGSTETRLVARDIFLDGNTWQASPSVAKRPVVADLNVGVVLRFPLAGPHLKGLQLTYAQNYRTKEFYGQKRPDVFGSLGLSFLF